MTPELRVWHTVAVGCQGGAGTGVPRTEAAGARALASRYPFVARSCWFADVTGNTLAEVAATLPAEWVAILQERGRTRDLEATAAELLAELSR